MIPHRMSLKYFTQKPEAVDLAAFMGIFQRWIQKSSVEGLLLDVMDYKHIDNGPGIVLIGLDGDYSLDLANGQPGLLYTHKRHQIESLSELLNITFRRTLAACQTLEKDRLIRPPVRFLTGEAELKFLDHLRTPNTADTLESVRSDVQKILETLYGEALLPELISTDARESFGIRIRATNPPDIATLLSHLETGV